MGLRATPAVSDPVAHSRPCHDESDEEAAVAVLRSRMTSAGERCAQLAESLRVALDGRYAVTVASGTLALLEALRGLRVGPRQEVILPTYVCSEVLDAVLYLGATPVLCDVDRNTFAPSTSTVSAACTARTGAVIVPHMFGIPADVDVMVSLGFPIVEDLAQGLGAVVRGRPAGSLGAASVLSFKAIKMISAGEGGAVVVRDRAAARCLRALHNREDPRQASFSFPLSDLAAAVGHNQWRQLPRFIERRRYLARRYVDQLDGLSGSQVHLPRDFPGRAWYRFPVELLRGVDPGELRICLAAVGVQVRRPVDALLHRRLGLPTTAYPVAEELFARTISLPLYPALTEAQQDKVVTEFRRAIACATPVSGTRDGVERKPMSR